MSIAEVIVPDLRRARSSTRNRVPDPPFDADSEVTEWTSRWSAWGTTATVSVTDPAVLPAARRLVRRQFAAAEKAAARFRPDAEVHRLYRAGGRVVTVSPLLAELISAALAAAERTDGDVDPTVAAAVTAVRATRRRDVSAVPVCAARPARVRPVPGWQQVDLRGRRLRVPPGTTLDLSATATAVACDLAAARVRDRLRVGVLVTLGGDATSAGLAPASGWQVTIDDRAGGPRIAAPIPAGASLATSHFSARRRSPELNEHSPLQAQLIDPRTGRPPAAVWRTATVIDFSGLEAAAYAAAALVRGTSARAWLAQLGIPARLVTVHDDVITVGPWRPLGFETVTSITPDLDGAGAMSAGLTDHPTALPRHRSTDIGVGADPIPTPRPAYSRRTTHS